MECLKNNEAIKECAPTAIAHSDPSEIVSFEQTAINGELFSSSKAFCHETTEFRKCLVTQLDQCGTSSDFVASAFKLLRKYSSCDRHDAEDEKKNQIL